MEYLNFPPLTQKVSRIALGTWAIGGWMWGGTKEKEAIETIHKALDLGINLIDTAPVYGFGVSEEIVGKAIKSYGKRENIVIATKQGLRFENQAIQRDARKESIEREIEESLRRLQVDYIDIYQIHWPDPLTPARETAEALQKLFKQGKVRAIGVSNYSIEQMEEFQKTAPIHSLQSPFNLFERAIEKEELAYCIKKEIATLGYGPLCRGLLTGKIQKDTQFKGDDLRKIDPKFQEPRLSQYLNAVKKLEEWVKNKHHRSLLALAIRWVLDKGVTTALWGARKPEQLSGMETIWNWNLTSQDFSEIDTILSETILDPVGPEFMAPPPHR